MFKRMKIKGIKQAENPHPFLSALATVAPGMPNQ
jgi:hypothetical protein